MLESQEKSNDFVRSLELIALFLKQSGRASSPYISIFVLPCCLEASTIANAAFSATGSKGLGFLRIRIQDFKQPRQL
jgi:hypothetical protein